MAQRVGPLDPADVAVRPHRYYRRRYVWQWPIRIFHWVNAICVAVLFATGLYIAQPVMIPSGEAYRTFFMATVRKVHFLFAFLFLLNFLWRIYWFWMGNNYARSGFPMFWKREWWQDLGRQGLDYLKLDRGHVHLGHNALGGLVYTIFVILMGWLQIFTGLSLYSQSNPGGILNSMFGWIAPLFGGLFQLYMWHYLFAWGFLVFTILHVYIVLYDGQQYKNGLLGSMISGEKFYQEEDLDNKRWLS
jgi:Ni/Fe-hydrogenase 1 B-type cytochrome subunit